MRLGRAVVCGALPALTFALFAACGGDDDGKKSGSGGTSGSGASAGSGGAAGGGASGGAGAGGGSGGTAGSGGAAGSGGTVDAGPQCSPIDQVPEPIYQTLDLRSSCITKTPCGGTIAEGEWILTEVCLEESSTFGQAFARCSAVTVRTTTSESVDGSLVVNGSDLTLDVQVELTGAFDFPNACHGCQCSNLEPGLGPSASCSPQCAGGTCFCTIDETETISAMGPFTTTGTELAVQGRTFDYCASSSEVTLQEHAGGPSLTFRPAADLVTPEICDGVDNDRNGTVDDDPVECPDPCNTLGVCADVDVVCNGSSGWKCEYNSPALEMSDETICDGLDNDCDGSVDEGIDGCREVCNGLDDDGNGTVDDDPKDEPPCPTAQGVCTGGASPTCGGDAGWQCNYTSAEYERDETKCDAMDNDCDGLVDEGCGCSSGASKVFVLQYAGTSTDPANGISRANLDGSGLEVILDLTGSTVLVFEVNPADEKIYYFDFVTDQMHRVSINGGTPELVWSGETQQFSVNPAAARMYTECGISNICAFDLATPMTVDTVVQPASVSAMQIEPFTQKIYWADHAVTSDRKIKRANLDGTVVEEIFDTSSFAPGFMEVDPHRYKIYWGGSSSVGEANLLNNMSTSIYSSSGAGVEGVALDPRADKLYWTENNNDQVQRANLDGSSVEAVIPSIAEPWAIDLYLCSP